MKCCKSHVIFQLYKVVHSLDFTYHKSQSNMPLPQKSNHIECFQLNQISNAPTKRDVESMRVLALQLCSALCRNQVWNIECVKQDTNWKPHELDWLYWWHLPKVLNWWARGDGYRAITCLPILAAFQKNPRNLKDQIKVDEKNTKDTSHPSTKSIKVRGKSHSWWWLTNQPLRLSLF